MAKEWIENYLKLPREGGGPLWCCTRDPGEHLEAALAMWRSYGEWNGGTQNENYYKMAVHDTYDVMREWHNYTVRRRPGGIPLPL